MTPEDLIEWAFTVALCLMIIGSLGLPFIAPWFS